MIQDPTLLQPLRKAYIDGIFAFMSTYLMPAQGLAFCSHALDQNTKGKDPVRDYVGLNWKNLPVRVQKDYLEFQKSFETMLGKTEVYRLMNSSDLKTLMEQYAQNAKDQGLI